MFGLGIRLAIIVIIIFAIVVSLFILYYPEFANNPSFANDVAIIAVIVSVCIFSIERLVEKYETKKESKERKNNACDTILKEIENHRDAFYNSNPPEDFITIGNITYVNRVLNTNAYESILYSGLFTQLSTKTQISLSNLYNHIDFRNEMIDYLRKYEVMFFIHDDSIERHNQWLEKKRVYLKDIPETERNIKDLLREAELLIKDDKL